MLDAQTEVAKHHLIDAIALLERVDAQLAVSQTTTGAAFHTACRQALADSRSAAQMLSEMIAVARSARAI